MKFDEALLHTVAHCESCGIDDPFSLYCMLSDHVGADYAGKDAVRMLFEIDKRLQIVKNIKEEGMLACVISKEAYPAFKSQYGKREFCNFIDDLYCILMHSPRKKRQSTKKGITVAKKRYGGKQKSNERAQAPAPVRPNVYAQIPPNVPPKFRGLWLLKQAIKKK